MDQFRLLCMFSIFYVASVVVGIGYANKVNDAKSWMFYWNSALPKSPLPTKAVQQVLNPVGERSYAGIGRDAINPAVSCLVYHSHSIGSAEEFNVEPGLTTFFQGNDLQHSGKTVTMRFLKPTSNKAALLPRQVAKSIPFSSSKLPEILTYFRVKPKSGYAEIMKKTIEGCEKPAIKAEDKYCATSLESLIDFMVSKLGKHVQVYSTEAEDESKQEYRIETTGVQSIGDRSVVCHKESYVYGVFYCHKFDDTATKAYMVPLVAADGVTKAKAVAICHIDTTGWNPKHLAFRVLKIKPGNTVPVCHFLHTTSLLWVPM
ncbi:PREDICTED: dehydration-responsive protein RD22-like [Fragaria vesca subsp. vesca]|uniref:dehydration-responsive protein RD22-like n=1 Tax=Fragaria vesca subsp. vesca TaxID=101020 RepID=UPI0002C350EB|nr:PREDICTED: dehydration-responsive protein RD22-like [Fragaria vesca subsp. vesca]